MKCPHCKEDNDKQLEVIGRRDTLPRYRDYHRGVVREDIHVLCNTCSHTFYSERAKEAGQP